MRVFDGSGMDVINSGDIYDYSILGGRLGLFVFNQSGVTWSNLMARCQEDENIALYLDGESYLQLPNMTEFHLIDR